MSNYICNTRDGIIYKENKEEKVKKYFNNMIKFREKLIYDMIRQIGTGSHMIDILQVCPVGTLCDGICDYCYNKMFQDLGSNHIDLKKFKENLEYLIEYQKGVPERLDFSFSGGEFLLSPHMLEIIDIIFNSYSQSKEYYVRFMVSGMYDDNQLQYFDTIMQKLLKNEKVKKIYLMMTMDVDGSNFRKSIIKNMNNDDILKVSYSIIKTYKDDDRIVINGVSKISRDTNIDVYLDNINKFEDMNVSNSIFAIEHVYGKYSASKQQIKDTFTKISNEKELYFLAGTYQIHVNIHTDLSERYSHGTNIKLMELEDGIYTVHPFQMRCQGPSRTVVIMPNGFTQCQHGPYLLKNIKDIFVPSNRFCGMIQNNESCINCNLAGLCVGCNYMPCDDNSPRREFELQKIKTILQHPENWFITKNIFKEVF